MIEVTTDLILTTLKGWIETKQRVDAHTWLDATQKLNILLSDEHDKLFSLEQQVAQMKVDYLAEGNTSAAAKVRVEATDLYKDTQKQRAKIKMIEEAIRIAKIQARMKDFEYNHGT